ncbi:MAG: aminoglycoside phosphotransferase (APT) family kinase protein, partial [Candidatus Paceibacteria bacterium]
DLMALRDATRKQLLGEPMPLVLQHADLRNKHVQITPEGKVLGYLDWGSSRADDVPYFDLLQLIVHETKQARGGSIGDAWKALTASDETRDWERSALDSYAETLGLSRNFCDAMEGAFPVFVAAMAESNWDYSRPQWVHRSFGI